MEPADETELPAQLQALQDAAAAVAAADGVPPLVPQTPFFTLAPALANTVNYIDLASTSGTKHFKGATKPLNAQPFNFADASDLQVFLDLVLKKSRVWGWNTIFTIPVTNGTGAEPVTTNHNLLSKYGMIPLDSVRAQVKTYYTTPTKRDQDSFMSCQCLLSSLTLDFLKLITTDSNDYHLPPIDATDGPVPSGPLLLKLITSQAHVDSQATVSFLRTSLTLLDTKMSDLDSDIESFNIYVKAQIKGLSARGETSSDPLINLFKGCRLANDVEFLDFIRRKENAYEEGEDTNPNNLMADALVKFKARKLVGSWSAPTKEQGQILALTVQVEQLKPAKQPAPKKAPNAPQKKPKTPRKDNKWAWKDILSKEGKPTTKEFEGKHYHVTCQYHPNQWVCHSSEDCSKNPSNATRLPLLLVALIRHLALNDSRLHSVRRLFSRTMNLKRSLRELTCNGRPESSLRSLLATPSRPELFVD
jgi:hypothetical protein